MGRSDVDTRVRRQRSARKGLEILAEYGEVGGQSAGTPAVSVDSL